MSDRATRIGTVCGAEIVASAALAKQLDEFGVGMRRWRALTPKEINALPEGSAVLVLVWDVTPQERFAMKVMDKEAEDAATTEED